jgi:hypothetical protein
MASYASETNSVARTNGFAIAGLVCGIVGVFLASIILGPLAIIFGGIGLNRANHSGGKGKGMSIAGVALGVIDVVLFVIVAVAASKNGSMWHI